MCLDDGCVVSNFVSHVKFFLGKGLSRFPDPYLYFLRFLMDFTLFDSYITRLVYYKTRILQRSIWRVMIYCYIF
ncbi:hypothetical protein Hanom_Chr04g00339411 [Helianthus anomalus]